MEVELALILFAVTVLPIVLLLIMVVPASSVLHIPNKLVDFVLALEVVIEPMVLFCISTVPELQFIMPNKPASVVEFVNVIDPVPVLLPIILPDEVPIFTVPASIRIPNQFWSEEFE